jgi:hypothetical protein
MSFERGRRYGIVDCECALFGDFRVNIVCEPWVRSERLGVFDAFPSGFLWDASLSRFSTRYE